MPKVAAKLRTSVPTAGSLWHRARGSYSPGWGLDSSKTRMEVGSLSHIGSVASDEVEARSQVAVTVSVTLSRTSTPKHWVGICYTSTKGHQQCQHRGPGPPPSTMWHWVVFPRHSDDIRKGREGRLLKDWDVKRNWVYQIMTPKLEEAAYPKETLLDWKNSFTFLDKFPFNRQL